MKKITAFFAVVFAISTLIFAQASSDPKDPFYSLVERWETKRLISEQPPLRPYPLKLIDEILSEVIECDDEEEAAAATECYERIHKRPVKVSLFADGTLRFGQNDFTKQIVAGGHINGDFALPKWVTMGYSVGVIATNDITNASLPAYTAKPYFYRDFINVKVAKAYLDTDASAAFNYDFLYLQAGVNHSSFGPMYGDSAIISPDAKHTANFSLLLKGKRISYTEAFLGLSAMSPVMNPTVIGEPPLLSKKFLALHSLNGQIFDWLSASFYEVVIYGDRFEPGYLTPVPYIITQGLLGFEDNIFMGINFTVRPVKNLSWVNDIFLDDMELSQLLKLNFDTKIRGTFQSEIKYVFSDVPWLDTLRVGYTMVTPYMYAHAQKIINAANGSVTLGTLNTMNYQEYTTAGEPLGLTLSPNTEKIALSLSITPVKRLKITGRGVYMRHANVNESLTMEEMLAYMNSEPGYFATDGGIHNHQLYFKDDEDNDKAENYLPSAWNRFLFLSQPTQMHTIQAGFDVEYSTPSTKYGCLSLTVGYTFEHIINYGVDRSIFNGMGKTQDALGKWHGNATQADVEAALAAWRNALSNKTNHYVTFAVKYEW